jgi:hypothetical protein
VRGHTTIADGTFMDFSRQFKNEMKTKSRWTLYHVFQNLVQANSRKHWRDQRLVLFKEKHGRFHRIKL